MTTDACADLLLRDDPRLHATVLFAPKGLRGRLMALYAFDVELSRASRASGDSLIPIMRLQWWHDTLVAAETGAAAPAHEIAAPLTNLVQSCDGPARAQLVTHLQSMTASRQWELSPQGDLLPWAQQRFAPLFSAAMWVLTGSFGGDDLTAALGRAAGVGFALRTATAMARNGRATLLTGLDGEATGALARGQTTDRARDLAGTLARAATGDLARARALCPRPGAALPALLPALWHERVLAMASGPGVALGDLDDIDRPFDGLRLFWRGLSGRW